MNLIQKLKSNILPIAIVTLFQVSVAIAQYDIDISPDQSEVIAGTNVTYDIEVRNLSIATRNNAKVVTTLPDNVSFRAATVACDTSALPVITCPLGNLTGLSERNFRLTLRIEDDYVATTQGAGFYTLSLQASADTGSSTTTSNIMNITEDADLKVAVVANNTNPRAGDIFTLSSIVDNVGLSTARNVSLHTAFGAGGTSTLNDIVSVQSCAFSVSMGCGAITQFTCSTGNITLGQFLSDIGTFSTNILRPVSQESSDCESLKPTGRIRGSFRLKALNDMEISAVVSTESDTPEVNYDDNYSTLLFEVSDVSNLAVTKIATGEILAPGAEGLPYDLISGAPFPQAPDFITSPIAVTQGRRVRYAITVENNGPSEAENVVVTDRLPPGIVVVPGTLLVVDQASNVTSGSCSFGTPGTSNDKMICGLGTLSATTEIPANQHFPTAKTIFFDVKVDLELAPNTVLANDVTVTSGSFEDDNSDNVATAFSVVSPLVGVSGCSVGGPYTNILCADGSASINLNGFGFALPEGGPLSYNWSTDCPAGAFSDVAVPNPGFNFTTANPDNTPVSCQVELAVSNIYADSICTGAVTVVDCTVDCNGDLGGTASLDRCGVCEGDGNSCLGCVETDVSADLEDLSLANTRLLTLTLRASRQLANLGGDSNLIKARKIRRSAKKIHNANVTSTSNLGPKIVSCTNTSFCVNSSNVSIMSEISANATSQLDLLRRTVKKVRKASGIKLLGSRMLQLGNTNFTASQAALAVIPTNSSSCS